EEEDTDLHRLKRLAELEKSRGESPSKESPLETAPEVPSQTPPEIPQGAQKPKEPPPQKAPAPSEEKKEATVEKAEALPPFGIGKVEKILEFMGGLVFLLFLLDASFEGLWAGSPFAKFTIGATLLCVLVSVFFILKRGNFHIGVETTVSAF